MEKAEQHIQNEYLRNAYINKLHEMFGWLRQDIGNEFTPQHR